jgi:hypothetical protein
MGGVVFFNRPKAFSRFARTHFFRGRFRVLISLRESGNDGLWPARHRTHAWSARRDGQPIYIISETASS